MDEADTKSPWYGRFMLFGLSRNPIADWSKGDAEKLDCFYHCVFLHVFYLALDVRYGQKRLKKGQPLVCF